MFNIGHQFVAQNSHGDNKHRLVLNNMTTLTIKSITIVQMPLTDEVYLYTDLPDCRIKLDPLKDSAEFYCKKHFQGVPINIKKGY